MHSRFFFAILAISTALGAQNSALNLAPPAPMPGRPAAATAKPPAIRPSVLVLKPASDPLHWVEDSAPDADTGQWRTARRLKVDAVSHNADGIALQGYDVLSYLESAPQKGKPEFSATHAGFTWLFATAEHRNQFQNNPEEFIPEYGGFCAYSAAQGYPAPADPLAFQVLSGKLYLFFDKAVRTVWEQDQPHLVTRADRNWPSLHR